MIFFTATAAAGMAAEIVGIIETKAVIILSMISVAGFDTDASIASINVSSVRIAADMTSSLADTKLSIYCLQRSDRRFKRIISRDRNCTPIISSQQGFNLIAR